MSCRACEFGRIFNYEDIRPALLERMPAVDEAVYAAERALALGEAAAPGALGAGVSAAAAAAAIAKMSGPGDGRGDLMGEADLLGEC